MKFKTLYLIFFLALANFVFTSRSSGPAAALNADRTGSPLGPGSCQGCHSAGAFNPSIAITLLSGMDTITSYTPGEKYTLRIVNTADGSPAAYGMQAVALSGDDDVNAGTFGAAPSGTQIIDLNDRKYFEHSERSSSNTFEIEWTAPAENTGEVRIFSASIAANGADGTGGDGTAADTLVLTESVTSGIIENVLAVDLNIFPNPVSSNLNLQVTAEKTQNARMHLINTLGQVVQSETIDLVNGSNNFNFNVSHLPKGQYFLQLNSNGKIATKKILKL